MIWSRKLSAEKLEQEKLRYQALQDRLMQQGLIEEMVHVLSKREMVGVEYVDGMPRPKKKDWAAYGRVSIEASRNAAKISGVMEGMKFSTREKLAITDALVQAAQEDAACIVYGAGYVRKTEDAVMIYYHQKVAKDAPSR